MKTHAKKIDTEFAILVDGYDTGESIKTLKDAKFKAALLQQKQPDSHIQVIVAFFDHHSGRPTGWLRVINGGKAA